MQYSQYSKELNDAMLKQLPGEPKFILEIPAGKFGGSPGKLPRS